MINDEDDCHIITIINDEDEVNRLHIGDIAVFRESDNKIISNSKTIFILCNRCEKKEHFGTFKNNIFRCNFISDDGNVCHGLDALGKAIEELKK